MFIHAEDDILITEENIDSCLDATAVLPADEIAGFVHAKEDPQGNLYFDPPHARVHWIFHRSGNEASIRWLTLPMCSRHVSCLPKSNLGAQSHLEGSWSGLMKADTS